MSEQYSCFLHGDHTEEGCPKCDAPLSSNLVAELYNYGRGLEDTDRGSLCIRGAREIERLTAELKEEQEAAEDLLATLRKTETERDRVRAVLEQISTINMDDWLSVRGAEIARKTLAGAADETTGEQK